MACSLCLDSWGTTTCLVSSRPACTESAEDPKYVWARTLSMTTTGSESESSAVALYLTCRQDFVCFQ